MWRALLSIAFLINERIETESDSGMSQNKNKKGSKHLCRPSCQGEHRPTSTSATPLPIRRPISAESGRIVAESLAFWNL